MFGVESGTWQGYIGAHGFDFKEYVTRFQRRTRPQSSGFSSLDAALGGGYRPGLHILGGVPGSGKSALALQIAANIAAAGRPAVYYSLELPCDEANERLMSMISITMSDPFPFGDVGRQAEAFTHQSHDLVLKHSQGEITQDELESGLMELQRNCSVLAAAAQCEASYRNLVIADNMTAVKDINQDLYNLAAGGVKPFVVVDYLQYAVTGDPKLDSGIAYEKVSAIADDLTLTSKNLGIPIVLVSALNRDAVKDGKEPTLQAFRGSGHIEYNATTASVLIEEKEPEAIVADGCKRVNLWILKNRQGPAGLSVPFDADLAHNHFSMGKNAPAAL